MPRWRLYTIIACIVLVVSQVVFLLIPGEQLVFFNEFVRHIIVAGLLVGLFLFMGSSKIQVKMSYQANISAVVSVMLWIVAIVAVAFVFGGGSNVMTASFAAVMRNLWVVVLPWLCLEILRYRLIKSVRNKQRTAVAFVLAAVFAFANLSELRSLISGADSDIVNFFFVFAMPVFSAAFLVSFVAINGNLTSVLAISFIFNLGGTFIPILPTVDRIFWSLLNCALMFIVALIHYQLTDTAGRSQRKRIARAARRAPKSIMSRVILIAALGFAAAFFLRAFPVYPVVILTESMTGYANRGSLVIMRAIPAEDVLAQVHENMVLHYRHRGVEFVHRVVGFSYNVYGERLFITQGDANEFPDPDLLLQEDVIGTSMFSIPFIGYPNVFLRLLLGGF